MYTIQSQTSPRQYEPLFGRNVSIPVRAGFDIDAHIVRPDAPGRFPAIVSIHPFENDRQFEPIIPKAINSQDVVLEGGDFNFYVRRGYVIVMCNARGTGRSGGEFEHMGNGLIEDYYDVI